MDVDVFVSHEAAAKADAVRLQELLLAVNPSSTVFLSSDWTSLAAGEPWFEPIIKTVRSCKAFLAIITRPEAFKNLWINMEVGIAYGSRKTPKIFVYGGVPFEAAAFPLCGFHMIGTGDTNRWHAELSEIGFVVPKTLVSAFAAAFRQG